MHENAVCHAVCFAYSGNDDDHFSALGNFIGFNFSALGKSVLFAVTSVGQFVDNSIRFGVTNSNCVDFAAAISEYLGIGINNALAQPDAERHDLVKHYGNAQHDWHCEPQRYGEHNGHPKSNADFHRYAHVKFEWQPEFQPNSDSYRHAGSYA